MNLRPTRRWTVGRRRALVCLVAGLLTLCCAGCGARAAEREAPEYHLKAAFLYNFTKLAQWPPTSFPQTNSPLVIGVLGRDPFGAVLDQTVRDKVIDGRPLSVRRFNSIDEVAGCHLLFISVSERAGLAEILRKLSGRPVLTVSDIDRFAAQGGMLGLVPEGNELRVEVNTGAVAAAGLKLSSKILRLARIVDAPNRPPP